MLTIDLTALQANWLKLHTLGAGASVAGVIKANAYGLGAAEVGNALYQVGCREFFFATLDEALAAKVFLPPSAVIYLLGNSLPSDAPILIRAQIIPVLCSLSAIKHWAKERLALGLSAPSAIKVNTGMTRFGLDLHEFETLCADPDLLRAINPVLLMSHLACADEPEHPLNILQRARFVPCVKAMRVLVPQVRFSLANSSGIFLGSDWHFDLVRPGAALYGINPVATAPNPMRSVVSLTLPIRQVRRLTEAAGIGYGNSATLPEGARIAVVAGGYADGLHRTLGMQPEGLLLGQPVRAIGRISMDATVFDISSVTALSDEQLLGAQIEVINDTLSVDYLSKKNNALGYEILTSLGARYKRQYLRSSA